MGAPTRVPYRKRQLGRELRRLRERAGLTQLEAAGRLRYNTSKMSRFEQGQVPDFHVLRAMLDLYGLPCNDWEPLQDLWELATRKAWWQAYGLDDQGYVSMEDEAASLRDFQYAFIPGLLQTERYARALFDKSTMSRSRKTIETQVAVRMRRQQRLTTTPVLRLDAVIHENALRQPMDQAILREQLTQLLDRGESGTVTVRVLPGDAGVHDGMLGPFTVLSFPDRDDPDVGYVEHAFGAVHVEQKQEVSAATLRFRHLAKLALGPEDSRAFVERLAGQL